MTKSTSPLLAYPMIGLVFLAGFAGLATAGPIGYLQSEGRITVQPEGAAAAVRATESNYTVFSGDRLTTQDGSLVLVLNNGGVLGLRESSDATVVLDEQTRELEVQLERGTFLYALPAQAARLRVSIGDFQLHSDSAEPRRVQVEFGPDDISGMIEHLDNGHVRVSVREGQLQVFNAAGNRYLVAAGEEIGLLAGARSIPVDAELENDVRVVQFEAPERVGTSDEFTVFWDARDFTEDSYITIAPSGSDPEEFDSVASTTQGDRIEFQAPGMPGDYEIRFIDGETGLVTDFVYLQVVGDPVAIPWLAIVAGVAGASTLTWIICCYDDPDPPVSP